MMRERKKLEKCGNFVNVSVGECMIEDRLEKWKI